MEEAEVIREVEHIVDMQDKEHHILLYKIDHLYVEVYYSKEHNYITKFNAINNGVVLTNYFATNQFPRVISFMRSHYVW